MKRKLWLMAFAVILVMGVALGVHMLHRQAYASNLLVELDVNWGQQSAFDIGATAELLNASGAEYDPPIIINLTYNSSYTVWIGTFGNIPAGADMSVTIGST